MTQEILKQFQKSDSEVEFKIWEKRDFLKDLHPYQNKRTMESEEGKGEVIADRIKMEGFIL